MYGFFFFFIKFQEKIITFCEVYILKSGLYYTCDQHKFLNESKLE